MNMFFNDSYKETEKKAWEERGTGEKSKPMLKNGNFIPQEDVVLQKGKAYNLAMFLNMSDKNVRYISVKVEESTYNAENKLSRKDKQNIKEISNVFSDVISDEEIPF